MSGLYRAAWTTIQETTLRTNHVNFLASLAAASLIPLAAAAQTIKIGFNGDISGTPLAQSGQIALLGVQSAVEDINKKGGVLGRKLELVVRDDQGAPPKSIQNMNELIDSQKVVAVVGPTHSGNAYAWKHIPNQKSVPVMVPFASSSDITKGQGGKNFIFRISMVDRDQIAALMAYLKKARGDKKFAFLVDTTGYGQTGLKDLEEIAALHGLKPDAVEKFDARDTDMSSQLIKARSRGIETVVLWTQSASNGHIMRSMEKLNYYPFVLTSWAATLDTFVEIAGPGLVEKPLFMTTMTSESSPRAKDFYDRIANKLPFPSMFQYAVQGYDSLLVLAAAIEQAQSTDGTKIHSALEALHEPVPGYAKTYNAPFSATNHEALTAADYRWVKWAGKKLTPYNDATIQSFTSKDFLK